MRTKEAGGSRKSGSTTKGKSKMVAKTPSQMRGRTSQSSGSSGKGSHAARKSSSGKKGSQR